MLMSHALNTEVDVAQPQVEPHAKIEQQLQQEPLPAHHFHPQLQLVMLFQAYVSTLELHAEPCYAQITPTPLLAHTHIHLT